MTRAERMVKMIQEKDYAELLDWWEEIFEDGVPGADYFAWWMGMEE